MEEEREKKSGYSQAKEAAADVLSATGKGLQKGWGAAKAGTSVLDKATDPVALARAMARAPVKVVTEITKRGTGIIVLIIIILLISGSITLLWAGRERVAETGARLWEVIKGTVGKPFQIYENYLTQLEMQMNGSFYEGVQETTNKEFGIKIVNIATPVGEENKFQDQPVEIWGDVKGVFTKDMEERLNGEIVLNCTTNDKEVGEIDPASMTMWDVYGGVKGFTCKFPTIKDGTKTVFIDAVFPFSTQAYKEVALMDKDQKMILQRESAGQLERFQQKNAISSGGPAIIGLNIRSPYPLAVGADCTSGTEDLSYDCYTQFGFTIYKNIMAVESEKFKEIKDITIEPTKDGFNIVDCSPIRFEKEGNVWKANADDLKKYSFEKEQITTECKLVYESPGSIIGENKANVVSAPIKITADYEYQKRGTIIIVVKNAIKTITTTGTTTATTVATANETGTSSACPIPANLEDIPTTIKCETQHSQCKLDSTTLQQLEKAQEIAKTQGYELKVTSAYRTIEDQQYLYSQTGSENAAYPSCTAPHVLGEAVDVVLLKNGVPVAGMSSSLTPSDMTIGDRQTLENIMHEAGFVRYIAEFWHYEYGTARWVRGNDKGEAAIA